MAPLLFDQEEVSEDFIAVQHVLFTYFQSTVGVCISPIDYMTPVRAASDPFTMVSMPRDWKQFLPRRTTGANMDQRGVVLGYGSSVHHRPAVHYNCP